MMTLLAYLPERRVGITVGCSRALASAFFSERFSFRLLLDFLLLDWRGDLSATAGSSGLRDDAHARSRTMPVRARADPDGRGADCPPMADAWQPGPRRG